MFISYAGIIKKKLAEIIDRLAVILVVYPRKILVSTAFSLGGKEGLSTDIYNI